MLWASQSVVTFVRCIFLGGGWMKVTSGELFWDIVLAPLGSEDFKPG